MENFQYINPTDLAEASKLLGNNFEQALPFAGGTDLLGMMKNKIVTPEKVINLKSIPGLDQITFRAGKGISIGANVKIAEIAEHALINQKFTVLAKAANEVGSPQIRNMGTIGGNICQRPRCWYFRGDFHCLRKGGDICYAVDGENKYHCIFGGNPCYIVHPSDIAVALSVLDATFSITYAKKSRTVSINDFFVTPDKNVLRENILKPGEILTEITIPEPAPNTKSSYLKFKERAVWDFAIVSVAVMVEKNGASIKQGKVALGGVAPIPMLEKNISGQLAGLAPTEDNIKKLANTALSEAEPLEKNLYKLQLAKNLIQHALTESCA